ncbi:MAG: beta-lactamase family protein [Cyclobacteriaceae bacterium]|nr:beta-lactamase family protein [Cyclobacteriaceae bacterium]
MKKSTPSLILLLFVFSFCTPKNDLETTFDTQYGDLASQQKPGFAIGVIHQGEIRLSKGYGLANLAYQVPFTDTTVSDLGSVSKQLTTFALCLLEEQGKLSLNDTIRTYLPYLPAFGDSLTLHHLARHTSGLPDVYALLSLRGMADGDYVSQQFAPRFSSKIRSLGFLPGSQHMYSNTGYMLLAEIMGVASGQSFEAYMQQALFQPLGMSHTFIMDRQGEVFKNVASSYLATDEGYVEIYDNSTVQGAGGVYSTIPDMLRWLENFRNETIGSPATHQQMKEKTVLTGGDTISYALGITVDQYRGQDRITHNGSSAGYRSKLSYYPELKLGLIIKSNTPEIGYQEFMKMENTVLEALVPGLSPLKAPDAPTETTDWMPENLQVAEGLYYNKDLELTLTLTAKDGLLVETYTQSLGILSPVSENSFSNGFLTLEFMQGQPGTPVSFTLSTPRALNFRFTKMDE